MLAALQFLTRVPIRLRKAPDLNRTVAWFPLAGAVIGAAVGGVAAGLWHVIPVMVAAAVAIAVGLLITGAFHEDGLGDIADAFGGGWTVERRLEILKDSRHGTYGVAAICTSIVLRVVALSSLTGPWMLFTAAVAAHTMGRVAAVAMAGTMPLATHSGLGADYGRGTTPVRALVGCASGVAVTTALVGWWALPLAGAVLVAVLGTGLLARRKIGGISGDVLGATEQVAEILCLVVLTAQVV
ncbi:MAG: adenosylcobinamide-GDP ribazoletransferase [Ilumatobacteraceae bacterium]